MPNVGRQNSVRIAELVIIQLIKAGFDFCVWIAKDRDRTFLAQLGVSVSGGRGINYHDVMCIAVMFPSSSAAHIYIVSP